MATRTQKGYAMAKSLREIREDLDRKKRALKATERMLKEREKRQQARKFSTIGRIAAKTGIDRMESQEIYGAFLSIAKEMNSPDKRGEWRALAEAQTPASSGADEQALALAFKEEPTEQMLEGLRKRGFQFNEFREEYYGYARKSELRQLLQGVRHKIEVVN